MSKWQDISINDSNLKAEFITRFFNGDYISAFRIIEDNPQLNTKVFLANVMNEISNLLSLLQNNFQSNVIDYLANELDGFNNLINEFNLKGSWDSETTYEIYNFVIYNDIDYLYINPTPSSGNLPTNTNYWLEINIRGKTGEPGLGVNLKYDWDSTIEYQPLDVVYYNNALWVATATNVNKRPDENSGTIWQTLTGNIITFTNNNDLKFKNIAANFTPIQDIPDYQFVEYIESSGTQYINTGISLNEDDFIIECRFARTEATAAEQAIFSIWEGTSNYWNAFVNSGGLVDIYTAGHHYPQNTAITNGIQYDLTLQRSTNHWKATFNGSEVTWDFTPSINNSTTIKLFTRGDTPSTNFSNTHAKIYYVKIYRDGTLVGNFVPAVRPSDSAIGMYDSVSKTFFANTGTGTFVKGSNITIPNPNIICPINGWTECEVVRTGKNLLDPSKRTESSSNIGYYSSNGILFKGGQAYTLSVSEIASGLYIKPYPSGANLATAYNKTALTYTPPNDVQVFFDIYYTSAPSGGISAVTCQLELGSTASDYEPYSGTTVAISFGTTVYGGTLTVNEDGTGTVTVDRVTDTFTKDSAWYGFSTGTGNSSAVVQLTEYQNCKYVDGASNRNGSIASTGKEAQNYWVGARQNETGAITDMGFAYSSTGQLRFHRLDVANITDLASFKANFPDTQICYYLATPLTFTVTADRLTTLVGVNNVWADTNGDTTIELAQKYWEIFLPFKLIKIYSNTTAPTGDDLYNGVIWFEMLTS